MFGARERRHSATKCKSVTEIIKKYCVFKGLAHGARIFTSTYSI